MRTVKFSWSLFLLSCVLPFGCTNWQTVNSPALTGGQIFALAHNGETIVAVGMEEVFAPGATSVTRAAIWYSSDGRHWRRVPHDESLFSASAVTQVFDILWWKTRFVAVGETGDRDNRDAAVWLSSDGRTWTRVPQQSAFEGAGSESMRSIAQSDVGIIVVGTASGSHPEDPSDPAAWFSADGMVWSRFRLVESSTETQWAVIGDLVVNVPGLAPPVVGFAIGRDANNPGSCGWWILAADQNGKNLIPHLNPSEICGSLVRSQNSSGGQVLVRTLDPLLIDYHDSRYNVVFFLDQADVPTRSAAVVSPNAANWENLKVFLGNKIAQGSGVIDGSYWLVGSTWENPPSQDPVIRKAWVWQGTGDEIELGTTALEGQSKQAFAKAITEFKGFPIAAGWEQVTLPGQQGRANQAIVWYRIRCSPFQLPPWCRLG